MWLQPTWNDVLALAGIRRPLKSRRPAMIAAHDRLATRDTTARADGTDAPTTEQCSRAAMHGKPAS